MLAVEAAARKRLARPTGRLPADRRSLPRRNLGTVELRQLRYFVAVADELNFRRAADKLLIAGPSLSQQIKALERDLGVRLFDRDRRSVALTPAGAALLPHTRAVLERADDVKRRAAQMSGSEPVRLGYVAWLPADLAARTSAAAQLRLDTWTAPSHAQAARVGDGTLDLAVCWVRTQDLEQYGLRARLIGADRLYAVTTGEDASDVRAKDTAVLLDNDTTSWASWNLYAAQLAHDTGMREVRISDGGITGSAFFDHVRRSRRPVINSPKGQNAQLPADMVRRRVIQPAIFWTWSLVWRRGEDRAAVFAVVDALTEGVGDFGIHEPDAWLPDGDPHKQ
jgi:DNA-binding transcriptional LysR family regulator